MEAPSVEEAHPTISGILKDFRCRHLEKANLQAFTEADIIRLLSNIILARLEAELKKNGEEESHPLWGKDETALSVLVKITQVLTKLSELEKRQGSELQTQENYFHISDSDLTRLKDYARRLASMDSTHTQSNSAQ